MPAAFRLAERRIALVISLCSGLPQPELQRLLVLRTDRYSTANGSLVLIPNDAVLRSVDGIS